MGVSKYHLLLTELNKMSSCYLLTALLVLLPLNFIPQAESHAITCPNYDDDDCVVNTLSCLNPSFNNILGKVIMGLPCPADCGRACQRWNKEGNQPECTWWTMLHLPMTQCYLLSICDPSIADKTAFTGDKNCPPLPCERE